MYQTLLPVSLNRRNAWCSLLKSCSQRTLHQRTLLLRSSRETVASQIVKRPSNSTSIRVAKTSRSAEIIKGVNPFKNTKLPTKKLPSVYSGSRSARVLCPEPLAAVKRAQLSTLDPTGARTRLFEKGVPEAAKVGDVLLVKQKSGDPYAGVCIDIRRRGIDTSICLRNSLTRVGVEVWFKIYSPAVEAIEVVQRKEKRARRARLYYMRHPKHDIGSVSNIVYRYQQERRALFGNSPSKGRDANSHARNIKNTKS